MASAEYHRQWRAAHLESARASGRRYAAKKRAADPEAHRQRQREWAAKRPAHAVWLACKGNSKRKGLAFELDEALVLDLITDNCFYCTTAPAPHNGIDRVDNTRGYAVDNVVSCCFQCNFAKSNMTFAAFSAWVACLSGRYSTWRGVTA